MPYKLSRRQGGEKGETVGSIGNCKRENITNWLARNGTEKTFILQVVKNLIHRVLVRPWLCATCQELQSLFNLAFECLSKLGSWSLAELVKTGGNRALVSQIAGNLTLLLKASATNKSAVKDKSVLRRLSLCLESSEKSLLSAENLDGGGRVLGKLHQAFCVGD